MSNDIPAWAIALRTTLIDGLDRVQDQMTRTQELVLDLRRRLDLIDPALERTEGKVDGLATQMRGLSIRVAEMEAAIGSSFIGMSVPGPNR